MRDGADHLMTVEYGTINKRMTTCPIRAVAQCIAVGTALGWNMTQIPLSEDPTTAKDGSTH